MNRRSRFASPGTLVATALLAVGSYGFSFYTANIGNYSAVYGSIGAVIVLMIWLYLVGLVLLIGAQINAEFESTADTRAATT